MSQSNPLFAFLGTSIDSRFAYERLIELGLEPALVVDTKVLPDELYNTDWDFVLVASYGKILPRKLLDLPKRGCLNIHPSLLPRYRGPSPYISAILDDERQTGVSLMLMEEKMDAGPVLAQARIEIAKEDWPPPGLVLSRMLFTEGVNLLAEILPDWLASALTPAPQDESQATYTKKYTDADARIPTGSLSLPIEAQREAFLKIRAFDKSPRAHFYATGSSSGSGQARRVIVTDATWQDGRLDIKTVIPEGKREMPYEAYLRGAR